MASLSFYLERVHIIKIATLCLKEFCLGLTHFIKLILIPGDQLSIRCSLKFSIFYRNHESNWTEPNRFPLSSFRSTTVDSHSIGGSSLKTFQRPISQITTHCSPCSTSSCCEAQLVIEYNFTKYRLVVLIRWLAFKDVAHKVAQQVYHCAVKILNPSYQQAENKLQGLLKNLEKLWRAFKSIEERPK